MEGNVNYGCTPEPADAASAGPQGPGDPAHQQPPSHSQAPCDSYDSQPTSKRLCRRNSGDYSSYDMQGSILCMNTRLLAAGILPVPAPADASGSCDTSLLVSSKVLKAALAVKEGRRATPWFGGAQTGAQPGPSNGAGGNPAAALSAQQQQKQHQQQWKRPAPKYTTPAPPAAAAGTLLGAGRRGAGSMGVPGVYYKQQQQHESHPYPNNTSWPPLSATPTPKRTLQLLAGSQQQQPLSLPPMQPWQQPQQRQPLPYSGAASGGGHQGIGGIPTSSGLSMPAAAAAASGCTLQGGRPRLPLPIMRPPSILPQEPSTSTSNLLPGHYSQQQQQQQEQQQLQQVGAGINMPGSSPGPPCTTLALGSKQQQQQAAAEGAAAVCGKQGGAWGSLPPAPRVGSPHMDLSDHSSGTVVPGLYGLQQQQQQPYQPQQQVYGHACHGPPVLAGAAQGPGPHDGNLPVAAVVAASQALGPSSIPPLPPAAAAIARSPAAGPAAATAAAGVSHLTGPSPPPLPPPAAAAGGRGQGQGATVAPAELLSRVGGPEAFLELLQKTEAAEAGAAARLLQQWGLNPHNLLQLLQQVLEGRLTGSSAGVPHPTHQQPYGHEQQQLQAPLPPPLAQLSPPQRVGIAAGPTAGQRLVAGYSSEGTGAPPPRPCDLPLPGRSRKRDSLAALQAAASSSRLQVRGAPS